MGRWFCCKAKEVIDLFLPFSRGMTQEGKWIKGFPLLTEKESVFGFIISGDVWAPKEVLVAENATRVRFSTISSWIGQKDCTGRNIFEGDLLVKSYDFKIFIDFKTDFYKNKKASKEQFYKEAKCFLEKEKVFSSVFLVKWFENYSSFNLCLKSSDTQPLYSGPIDFSNFLILSNTWEQPDLID